MNRIVRLASLATVILMVCTVTGCPPSKPVVTEIEVVPGTVAVASHPTQSTTFVLEARLWTGLASKRTAIVESEGVIPTWSLTPSGSGIAFQGTAKGYRVTLVVPPGTNPAAEVTVKAQAGGMAAEGTILPSVTSGADLFEASYADGLIPSALVARGIRTPSDNPCAVWLSSTMIRVGMAGSISDVCSGPGTGWGVALLDPAHAMDMSAVSWTPAADKATTSPVAVRAIPIAIRVLIGGAGNLSAQQNTARSFVLLEVDDANTVLADSRAGVKLEVKDLQTITPPNETSVANCAAGDVLTANHDHSPAMLHVYVVNETTGADAFTCAAINTRPQPVIYLAHAHSGTILAHEVGHALGLTLPRDGHSDDVAGFDPANVMASGYADTDNVWRRRLSVGQVLRMNADPASWLNWGTDILGVPIRPVAAPRVECQCGHEDPPGPCPRLVDDVARPRGGLRQSYAWDCSDLIKLPPLGTGEEPLALIAGRRWRTAPSDCPQYVPGRLESHAGAKYIQTENLTRAGNCPSWVAVFFQQHAPIFRDLVSMAGVWSDAANHRLLDRTPTSRTPVTMHVYYDPQDFPQVSVGIADAIRVYDPIDRSGVDLQFVPIGQPPQPCPAAPPGGYAICYSSAAGVTVPQLVGQALGLPLLTSADLTNPAFAGNAMVAPPGTAGKLTLGQLFRIHSTIRTPGFPDCTLTGAPCPPLDADVTP